MPPPLGAEVYIPIAGALVACIGALWLKLGKLQSYCRKLNEERYRTDELLATISARLDNLQPE